MDQIEQQIHCPYCNESITVLIDPSVELQYYTEDCQVCCHPIVFSVWVKSDTDVEVRVAREDE